MRNIYIAGIILILVVAGTAGFYQFSKENNNKVPTTTPLPINNEGYSLDDIASHSTENDCWMAIENNVYDVTKYISDHPGGKDILLGCGKDATSYFNNRPGEGTPHPKKTQAILSQFIIGRLK